jgi:hypothetical protein
LEQHERIVSRGRKAAFAPERRRFVVYGVNDQRTAADQFGRGDAALPRMFEQADADAEAAPVQIDGKAGEQKAGDRIRRLAGSDGAGKDVNGGP